MKAKAILSLIAIFTIIGASLAFKAQRTPHAFFKKNTTTSIIAHQICTLPVVINYTVNPNEATGGAILQTLYATTTFAGDCQLLIIYPAD